MKTRSVDKSMYRNYLKKAREFLNVCNDSFQKEEWNAVVVNAIHAGISASDALTVFFLGIRHAGERHEDVVRLLNTLDLRDIKDKNKYMLSLLNIKNKAEYEENLMSMKNAESAKKSAERFLDYVESILKQ